MKKLTIKEIEETMKDYFGGDEKPEQLELFPNPVPMTEKDEYRNAGITKEKAEEKWNLLGNSQ